MGLLEVMGQEGDTKIIWDRNNDDEVKNAKRTFDDLKKKGFSAFSVTKKGDRDEQIKEFDPDLEKIIMVPKMAGG